jgi:hypothetical protein
MNSNSRELGVCELLCQLVHDDLGGFGLSSLLVKASGPFTQNLVNEAWKQIYLEQPLFRARLKMNKDKYHFVMDVDFENIPIDIIPYNSNVIPIEYYEQEFDDLFPSEKYLWRIKWFKPESIENDSFFIFSYNHVLAEGGSAYNILNDFLRNSMNIYNNSKECSEPFALMPKLEDILPGTPSTFETYMASLQDIQEGDSDEMPASGNKNNVITTRPFDEYVPVGPGKRKTHCVFHLMNELKLKGLIKYSKKHEVTINDLLNAVILKVVQSNNNSPVEVILETPINLKAQCIPPVPNKYFGLYIGIIPVQVTVDNQADIATLAKEYKKVLERENKTKSYYFPQSATVSEVSDNIAGVDVMKARTEFAYSFMITNMGRFNFTEYSPFKIKETYVTGGRGAGDQILLIAVTTVNNVMNLSFSYSYPLLSDENAVKLIDSFMDILNNISHIE